jgi:para-nitrobenzyl esterase
VLRIAALTLGLLAATVAVAQTPAAPAPETPVHAHAHVHAAKLSVGSTVSDLLASPAAKAVLEKHVPNIVKDERLGMVMGLPFRDLQQFPEAQLTPEIIAAVEADLAKL